MKDKILMLILGILIGAIITTGGFLIFGKNTDNNFKDIGERPNRENMGNFVQGQMDANAIPTRPEDINQTQQNVI